MALVDRRSSVVSDKAKDVVPTQPRRRARVAGHCLKFWWAYLMAFACTAVLVVCLVIFVGIPRMAHHLVDQATLVVDGISATQTESNSYQLGINSTLLSPSSSVSATFDPFQGFMYLEDLPAHTPFVKVDFPAVGSDSVQTINISQHAPVIDLTAFTAFDTWLLQNDSVLVTVSGNTQVRVAGIAKKFGINFTKTVRIPGLRKFAGVNITQSTISLQGDAEGNNLAGYVTVPNSSPVTFEIGNVTFDNYLNNTKLGTVRVYDMTVRPGTANNFSMRANVSQAPILAALTQRPYCENGGKLPITLVARSVVNHGQPLAYFADALQSGNLTTVIDVGSDLRALGLPASILQCAS